ncbi:MAR binding filament-like protein 1 [Wolffia australiana]
MVYSMAGSSGCTLQSPIFQSSPRFLSSSSSQRRAGRRKAAATSAVKVEKARACGGAQRRALVLVGLSSIPFFQLPALAFVEGLDLERISEKEPQDQASGSPLISLLNEIGIVGSGVLGALYAITSKEKTEMESSIASMNTALSQKEAAMVSLEKDFERRLESQQEANRKQVGKLKAEEALLIQQLASAKDAMAAIGVELKSEKRLAENLKLQIDQLRAGLAQSQTEKKALEGKLKEKQDSILELEQQAGILSNKIEDKELAVVALKSALSERESEINRVTSAAAQTRSELEEAVASLARLEADQVMINGELNAKTAEADELVRKIDLLIVERDDVLVKNHVLKGEFDQLKSNFEQQSGADAEQLKKRDEEIRRLEENLGAALGEARSSWALITELTSEKDGLIAKLEEELKVLEALRDELKQAQQSLEDSKLLASDLQSQLQESQKVTEQLTSEISRISGESAEAHEQLKIRLEEAVSASKVLSDELELIKGALTKAQGELAATSGELKAAGEAREELQRELALAAERSTATAQELAREREAASSLKDELSASARRGEELSREISELEGKLAAAAASLAEVNQRFTALTQEVEDGKSVNATLQAEKEMLYVSLTEQSNATREARVNLEDAQSVINRLGEERERLEKKVIKYEEELAASKADILRLRRQASLEREAEAELSRSAKPQAEGAAQDSTAAKRAYSGRRRKAGSAVRNSQPEI